HADDQEEQQPEHRLASFSQNPSLPWALRRSLMSTTAPDTGGAVINGTHRDHMHRSQRWEHTRRPALLEMSRDSDTPAVSPGASWMTLGLPSLSSSCEVHVNARFRAQRHQGPGLHGMAWYEPHAPRLGHRRQ